MRTPDPLEKQLLVMRVQGFTRRVMERLMEAAGRQGRAAKMILVDDPNSPEGRAAADYIHSHGLLPPDYLRTPLAEAVAAGERLDDPETPLAEQKRTLMLLAHHRSEEALAALKRYREREHDPEMATWARLAQTECEEGLLEARSGQPVHSLALAVSKVGRNEPCPCGSGHKFKRCCGR